MYICIHIHIHMHMHIHPKPYASCFPGPLLTPCTHIVGSYNVGKLRAEGGMMPSPAVRFPMARRTLPSDEVCAQSEVGKIMQRIHANLCMYACPNTCTFMYACTESISQDPRPRRLHPRAAPSGRRAASRPRLWIRKTRGAFFCEHSCPS
jgi:hypothetical protein